MIRLPKMRVMTSRSGFSTMFFGSFRRFFFLGLLMSGTYQTFCRPCHVPFENIGQVSGDVECPSCGIRFVGSVLTEIIEEERRRDRFNAEAERRNLPLGKRGEVRMLPSKIPDNLRNQVLVIRIPD